MKLQLTKKSSSTPSAIASESTISILNELGSRICIIGPSNSGKSTLADAIARKQGLAAIHLDQLFHFPLSDWVPRPSEEFRQLHNEAIMQEQWVMDGNYTRYLAQRLSRATGLILLDVPTVTSLCRYLRRTCLENDRRGGLAGGADTVKWRMLYHIAFVTPRNRRRYGDLYEQISLPKIKLATTSDLNLFYAAEQLSHR